MLDGLFSILVMNYEYLRRFEKFVEFQKCNRDALNLQNLEISPDFPDFPDFELRSPERSQKSEISWFLHGKSPEWTGIDLK